MRLAVIAAVWILCGMAGAQAAPLAPDEQEIDVCVKAAAATDHVAVRQVDRGACQCATADLHKILKPGDYDLHERMLEIIASGADEKTFNKQMSDLMLQRGMNQSGVDAFLARTQAAQRKAQEDCDPSIMLDPPPANRPGH
jgi:hypothetical protein